ncbi:MAG: tetratricopeptide repeat protein [Alphaproteobacteria bacterium]|nr:tetratricopeptide repeat protein [Alphaproteobacteria bacterium]
MALKPIDNETFYREVDEELRRDQMLGLWKRYGKLAIAGVVLFIAAIGGVIWWMNQREIKAGSRGETLIAAFDDISASNKAAARAKLDELAKSGVDGYRAASLLTQADMASDANQPDKAVALFKQVADDGSLASPYRDAALVRMTALQFDRLPPQQVIARLKPLAVPGAPWFGSAGEMVAGAYLKLNRPQDAGKLFAAIAKDKKVPDSIRSRALQMAGSLGVDAVQDTAATGATQEGNR